MELEIIKEKKYKASFIHKVYPNHLKQCFITQIPNESWVSDRSANKKILNISFLMRVHIRTHEGWLYLAIVLDLFSRRIIG